MDASRCGNPARPAATAATAAMPASFAGQRYNGLKA
jgi:hypothetical protein